MTNNQTEIIDKTAEFVKQKFTGESTGHDWWHMYRVWQLSKTIGLQEEDSDLFVVELAGLLHDIADWKFHEDAVEAGPQAASDWLAAQKVAPEVIEQVAYIVRYISFKGGTNTHVMESLEGKIVQDADRLDGTGAIGIARAFAFGGHFGHGMHDPAVKPKQNMTFEEYKATITEGTTINHFYEKLLKLKDGMHTDTAKRIAQQRHDYMEKFLEEFYAEWDGKR